MISLRSARSGLNRAFLVLTSQQGGLSKTPVNNLQRHPHLSRRLSSTGASVSTSVGLSVAFFVAALGFAVCGTCRAELEQSCCQARRRQNNTGRAQGEARLNQSLRGAVLLLLFVL